MDHATKIRLRWLFIVGILIVPTFFFPPTPAGADDGTARVSITTVGGLPGEQVQVVLLASFPAGNPIYGYLAQINFDPEILSYQGYDRTGTLSSGCAMADNLVDPQTLRLAAASVDSMELEGTLIKLNFLISETAEVGVHIPVTFDDFYVNEGDPPSETSDGGVYIGTSTGLEEAPRPAFRIGPLPVHPGSPTLIHFEDWSAKQTVVEIFDPRGRRVLHFEPDLHGRGAATLPLAMVDPQGRGLPAGVYYYRVRADLKEYRGKLSVLR